jgi:hypothetical protein
LIFFLFFSVQLGSTFQRIKIVCKTIFFDEERFEERKGSFRDLFVQIKEKLDEFQPECGRLGDGKDRLEEFASFAAKKMVCDCPSPACLLPNREYEFFLLLLFHALFYLFSIFFWRGEEFMRSCRCWFILQGKSEDWELSTKWSGALEKATNSTKEQGEYRSGPQKRRATLTYNILTNLGSRAAEKSRDASRASLFEACT